MSNLGENWVCPYCNRAQVILEGRCDTRLTWMGVKGCEHGLVGHFAKYIVCANDECRKLSLQFYLVRKGSWNGTKGEFDVSGIIEDWRLLPASFARPQPDYIPEPLRRDYEEACAIRDLSPKASATLTRRCIQGIIRDFCGISKKRLIDEINELRDRVDNGNAPTGVQADTVDAIDHVRSIGNIGAHMEADINVIVDVDPDEAQKLIEPIELLFDEWYVARERRQQRLAELGVIAGKKAVQHQKKLPAPSQPQPAAAQP
jgi:Domain of unknown function (DUF4145)